MKWGTILLGGLAIAAVVSLVILFSGQGPVGSENLIGKPLPDFAVPLATSDLDGDSNIFTPEQAKATDNTAACDVTLEGSINSCEALKGDAMLVFINSNRDECVRQIDVLDEYAASNPDVNVLAVAFEEDKAPVKELVENEGWKIPVAVDRDGATASLYSVTGCPTVFAAQDGEVTAVKLGVQDEAALKAMQTDG
jgi:hypothetical protein